MSKETFNAFDKCASYSILTIVVANTINSMNRFRRVPKDQVITNTVTRLKGCASK